MYAHILSSVIDSWGEEPADDALLAYTLRCRGQILATKLRRGDPATSALAAEVAYDRALLRLCAAHGIAVAVARFSHPRQERARLERELDAAGVDLFERGEQHYGP